LSEALIELNKILELNNADVGVWTEVADLNIRQGQYNEAAFCLEEIILIDPYNHVTHTKLADIYYTLGIHVY
jgi:tetratricopeptide (TPR) repeat protein